ncbi:MAG: hypothetical protein SVM80_11090 [Halobacteriota archaeon]|nr:hypothetical protein [Halobacteriota archaeon]
MGAERTTDSKQTAYNLIDSVSIKVEKLKQKNMGVTLIEEDLNGARDAYNSGKYDEAIEFVENANKMAEGAYKTLSEHIEPAQYAIDEAKSI